MILGLPKDLVYFLYIVSLSFLVGLELKAYRLHKEEVKNIHFGSTRTFTFIGITGFIFYKINLYFYIAGYVSLSCIYLVYYFFKLKKERSSVISFLLLSLIYGFSPLVDIYNIWMPTLVFVLIVFILNANKSLEYLFSKINEKEFETLGKFLLLSAVILPLLPKGNIAYINISPFKIWLVVVIISAISYGSYISQKYLFKKRGYLLTGILGGLYSSTATTVVLSKKAVLQSDLKTINAAIVVATSMMYIRLWVIAAIFNYRVALILLLPALIFAFLGFFIAVFLYKKGKNSDSPIDDRNPLELGTAFLFAALFLAMMVLTNFVISHYGNTGLKILSFLIGFTDIDPFILSLLMGKFSISIKDVVEAILIASGSNNILKAFYALIFGKGLPKVAAFWIFVLGILSILYPYIFYLKGA